MPSQSQVYHRLPRVSVHPASVPGNQGTHGLHLCNISPHSIPLLSDVNIISIDQMGVHKLSDEVSSDPQKLMLQ